MRFLGGFAERRAADGTEPPAPLARRGDLPRFAPVELTPQSLRNSTALANATSEELLAAQAALERLAVPATPLTLAAALPEAGDPSRLVTVLTRLEEALASCASPEATAERALLTLASFLARFAPQEDEAAAQLSAFVDQIAIGSESKLLALLNALERRGRAQGNERLILTAEATERATALSHDVKTLLFSLLARSESDSLSATLTEALEAVTAAQLNSLNFARFVPGALSFVIPVAVDRGSLSAQVTIQREKVTLSIETERMGRVKARLETVGGAVRITFESPTTAAAEHIQAHLESLSASVATQGLRSVALTSDVEMKMSRNPVRNSQSTYVPSVRGTFGKALNVHVDTMA
jgi:hypothetical protein